MDCPVCENAMITLELAEVEIDYCARCGGIWLDAGELEMLLGSSKEAQDVLRSFETCRSTNEKARRCPICLKKMEKIIVGRSGPQMLLDRCGRGDGLWFDKGELKDVLARASLDKNSKIQKLLAEMFGHDVKTDQEES